jgi:hypothetical protein
MTKQQLIWNIEPAVEIEISSARKTSHFFQPAGTPAHRPIRISFPSRRRESCLTRRAMLAALREAEFDNWQATGGDVLSSMHQSVC